MSTPEPYNPLDKINLGESVAEALLRLPVSPFSELKTLVGAGVYAIYYVGDYPAYATVKARNTNNKFDCPIYIGKAIPEGGRKGGIRTDASARSIALRNRLADHSRSIGKGGLPIEDFFYRALVVDDIWIPLGENVLIEKFQPLWNRVIDGFGNKTPGKGRESQKRSSWDVLHQGRFKDLALQAHGMTEEEIHKRITDFFAGQLPADQLLDDEEKGSGDEI